MDYSFQAYQVMRYGYSIFDYSRQYDREWTESVIKLMGILNLSTTTDDGLNNRDRKKEVDGSAYIHLKKYSSRSNTIPIENIYEIIAYLDERALCKVSLVCKQWNEMANTQEIWSNLLLKKFCVHYESIKMKKNADLLAHDDHKKTAKRGRLDHKNNEQRADKEDNKQQSTASTASAKVIFKDMSQVFDHLRQLKQVQPLKSSTIFLGYSLY